VGGAVIRTDPSSDCRSHGDDDQHCPHNDVDAGRFELLASAGRRSLADDAATEASGRLREALALWRGAPFASIAEIPDADAERDGWRRSGSTPKTISPRRSSGLGATRRSSPSSSALLYSNRHGSAGRAS